MGAIVFDEVQVIDLLRSNPVQVRSQPIERGDNMALRWTVDVRLGGKSVPSEGLAFAVYCARSDGVTVRGDDIRIEGSKIVTMIPQDAANVPGPVVCMLRLSGTDGENAALAWLSLTAVDTQGRHIGTLREVMTPNAVCDVYVFDTERGEMMIPALRRVVCEVDVAGGKIVLDEAVLPEVAVWQDEPAERDE